MSLKFEESKLELKRLLEPFSEKAYHYQNLEMARLVFPLLIIPDDVEEEQWRMLDDDKFAKDRYMISSWGRVFDIFHNHFPNSRLCDRGYVSIAIERSDAKILKANNQHTHATIRVHRLVALTFVPNPMNKETVNHINLEKRNNVITNLEWMTSVENVKHAYENDAKKNVIKHKYFTREEIDEIRLKHSNGATISSLGREYNREHTTISKIVKCITYKDDFWDNLGFNQEQIKYYKSQEKKKKQMSQNKELAYWKENAEEDYLHVPISVLRYISELEKQQEKNNQKLEEVNTTPRNPEVEGDMS